MTKFLQMGAGNVVATLRCTFEHEQMKKKKFYFVGMHCPCFNTSVPGLPTVARRLVHINSKVGISIVLVNFVH